MQMAGLKEEQGEMLQMGAGRCRWALGETICGLACLLCSSASIRATAPSSVRRTQPCGTERKKGLNKQL